MTSDSVDGGQGCLPVSGDGKTLARLYQVEQVAGNAPQFDRGGLVRPDVAALEDLARISGQELPLQLLGECYRQLRLSAGRGPDHRHHHLGDQGRLNSLLNCWSGRTRVVGRPCGQLIGSAVTESAASKPEADSAVRRSPNRTAP